MKISRYQIVGNCVILSVVESNVKISQETALNSDCTKLVLGYPFSCIQFNRVCWECVHPESWDDCVTLILRVHIASLRDRKRQPTQHGNSTFLFFPSPSHFSLSLFLLLVFCVKRSCTESNSTCSELSAKTIPDASRSGVRM